MSRIEQRIAEEISARIEQVDAAVQLIDGGATVPFIARYRKEATGGLDDTQLRQLEERLALRELEESARDVSPYRRAGKLDDTLRRNCWLRTKARLETSPAIQATPTNPRADRA